MAENAANISSIQHKKPNILELVAQESFMESVYPAFNALCSYISSKSKSNWLERWYDEAFFGTNLLLQYYYLKVFQSSFSEAFYGLKRIPISSQKSNSRLPTSIVTSSLFFLVFVPYISKKLKDLTRDQENSDIHLRNQKIINVAIKLRKSICLIYGSFKLYYLMSYLAGKQKVHDPLLKLSGVELIYQQRHLPSWRDMFKAVFGNKSDSSRLRVSFFFKLLGASLEMGAFFIQFLNWWHSDESKNVSKLPLPKPPHLNNGSDICGLCRNKRKNEVVLYTSGYLFCYLCIKEYLDKNGMCPLTYLPSSTDNIVRIYTTGEV